METLDEYYYDDSPGFLESAVGWLLLAASYPLGLIWPPAKKYHQQVEKDAADYDKKRRNLA